jgi:surfeit locus 1 family protein
MSIRLILRLIISRRWWMTSLLVLLATAVTIRLGIWQIDRYRQNHDFAEALAAMQKAEPLTLSGAASPAGLSGMEYRAAQATGTFDFSRQVAVRNQVWVQSWGNEAGYILVTPLVFQDGSAVLVDRGWVPFKDNTPASWRRYDVTGIITVKGVLRLPAKPQMGGQPDPTLAPGQASLDFWNLIDLKRLQQQLPYPILPVYIQQAPTPGITSLPYSAISDPETTDAGTNAGFASMWFAFSGLLFFGYPVYLSRQSHTLHVQP